MPGLSTFDMTRYHSNLARARRLMADGDVHALANPQGTSLTGVPAAAKQLLREAAARLLVLTDLVTEESQTFLRKHEEALIPSQIDRIREALAEDLYVDFDFGHPVETQNGWDRDGTNRMSRPVFLNIGGPETVQVEFGLRFAPGSAEVLAYGTDIDEPAPAPTAADTPEF